MEFSDKLAVLRKEIKASLSKVIDSDYMLLEVPHHANVGDFLIWQGELDLLDEFPYRCLGMYSSGTFSFPKLNPDVLILMNGGGSFGDVWRDSLDFKLEVVRKYPNNRILFFPQSVEFVDQRVKATALEVFKSHRKLIVCVRDEYSFDMLKANGIDTILVPDMAFYADIASYSTVSESVESLVVKRDDRESKSHPELIGLSDCRSVKVSDWPTIKSGVCTVNFFFAISWLFTVVLSLRFVENFIANRWLRKHMIAAGVRFVSQAKIVHAMRMHAAVLALVLGKKVFLYDNSYGKCRRFFQTWLADVDEVEFCE